MTTTKHAVTAVLPVVDQELQEALDDVSELCLLIQSLDNERIKDLLVVQNLSAIAANSGHEGFNQARAAHWSAMLLDFINNPTNSGKLFTSHEVLKTHANALAAVKSYRDSAMAVNTKTETELAQYAAALQKELLNLPSGASCCMAGGWDGNPGHAMVYRFEKTQTAPAEERFNIYIYNAQDGSDNLQGGAIIQSQTKAKPCYCFKDVTAQELFFTQAGAANPLILTSLLALHHKSDHGNYDLDNVLNICSRFGHRLVPSDQLPERYLNMQRSNDCTIKTINCLLLEVMGDSKAYQRLMLDMRFLSLVAIYKKFYGDLAKPECLQLSYILWCAISDYLKKLVINLKKPIITADEAGYQHIVTICHSMLDTLRTVKQQTYALAETDEKPSQMIGQESLQQQLEQRQANLTRLTAAAAVMPSQHATNFSLNTSLDEITSTQDLVQSLAKLQDILEQAKVNCCYQTLILQFELTISQLFAKRAQIVSSANQAQDREVAIQAQATLNRCLELYSESIGYLKAGTSPRIQNAGMAAMALSYLLAQQGDPEIGKYGLWLGPWNFDQNYHQITAPLLPYASDPAVVNQRNELVAFYRQINKHKYDKLFNFHQEESINKLPEARFYASYGEHDDQRKRLVCQVLSVYQPKLQPLGNLKQAAFFANSFFTMQPVAPLHDRTVYHTQYFDNKVYPQSILTQVDSSLTQREQPATENKIYRDATLPVDDIKVATSVAATRISALLQLLADNLPKVTNDCKWRRRVVQALFKVEVSVDANDSAKLAITEQTQISPVLINKINYLTNLYYTKCVQNLPTNQPNSEAMLFMLRLRASILLINPGDALLSSAATVECNKTMLAWLNSYEAQLNRKLAGANQTTGLMLDQAQLEKALLELRLARTGLLLSMPGATIPDELLIQIFEDMMVINAFESSIIDEQYQDLVRECRQRFVLNQQSWLQLQRQEFQAKLCNHLIKNYRTQTEDVATPTKPAALSWALNPMGQLCAQDWCVDLVRPAIMHQEKTLTTVFCEASPAFVRLFGTQPIKGIQTIDGISFKHAKLGTIDIVGKGENTKIYRYIPNDTGTDEKFLYLHPEPYDNIKSLQINPAWCWDHSLWIKVPSAHTATIAPELRIYALHDGAKCLLHTKNGQLIATADPEFTISPIPVQHSETLARFDALEQITAWTKDQTTVHHIEFSRYAQDQFSHQPLRFDWHEDQQAWVYTKDATYKLSDKRVGALHYTNQRYLYLVSLTNPKQHKILIPVGKLLGEGFKQFCAITNQAAPGDHTSLAQQYFEYEYEYDEQHQKIIPSTNNLAARVYLAHLYLTQKRYQDAKEVLKGISMSESLSDEAIALMRQLLASTVNTHDQTLDACAVRLYAYCVFNKINSRIQDFDILQGGEVPSNHQPLTTIWDIYNIYAQESAHVSQALALTTQEEVQLLDAMQISKCAGYATHRSLQQRRQVLTGTAMATHIHRVDKIKPFNVLACVASWFKTHDRDDYWGRIEISGTYPNFIQMYTQLQQANADQLELLTYQLFTEQLQAEKTAAWADKFTPMHALLYVATHQARFQKIQLTSISELQEELNQDKVWLEHNYSKRSEDLLFNQLAVQVPILTPSISVSQLTQPQPQTLTSAVLSSEVARPSEPKQAFSHNHDAVFNSWRQQFLQQTTNTVAAFTLPSQSNNLTDQQQAYAGVIAKEQARYCQDCQVAATSTQYTLASDFDPNKLMAALVAEFNITGDVATIAESEAEQALRQALVAYASQLPSDMVKQRERIAHQDGHQNPAVNLADILRAAAIDPLALQQLNPSLTADEVAQWRAACLDYMALATHRRQANLIYQPLKQWLAVNANHDQPAAALVEQVTTALSQARTYNLYDDTKNKNYFALMFEYFSELRIRPNQAKIIQDVLQSWERNEINVQDTIFQLIMAGGKTSVIISILLEMIAAKQKIPIAVCHPSQYASVRGNLRNFQASRFGKDLIALEYTMQELGDDAVLDEIIKKLEQAQAGQNAIIMSNAMPQLIELQYLLVSLRLAECPPSQRQQKWGSIQKLTKIINTLTTAGVFILDECDITLSMLMEVNVPIGDKQPLASNRAQLIQDIYGSLARCGEIDFKHNKQSELPPDNYPAKVLPRIADDLFVNPLLGLADHPEYRAAFGRYLQGELTTDQQPSRQPTQQQQQENKAFLQYLDTLHHNDDPVKRAAADQIALAMHLVKDVIPLALLKSYNRAYGYDPTKDDGSVIPYSAANEAATTQFGYAYLAFCYQLQTVLYTGITTGALLFWAQEIARTAPTTEAFDQNPMAQRFFACTGQQVYDVLEDDSLLQQACSKVNADQMHCLTAGAAIASLHVQYYHQRVCTNPLNLAEEAEQVIGCSGTTWNHNSYAQKLQNFTPEHGAEGKIVNAIVTRAQQEPNTMHVVQDNNLAMLLEQIKSHHQREHLRCLVDAGGFLKNSVNSEVAAKILAVFQTELGYQPDASIDAIIYLHRFPRDQHGRIRESFVLLQRTSEGERLIELPDTSPATIAKYVPNLDKLFVFYDESRATGTDIAMAKKTIGLVTIDPRMPIRALLQGVLRLRGYLGQEQQCEFVLTQNSQTQMVNQGATMSDVVTTLINNQAIAASDQVFSSYITQISNVVRNYVKQAMLEAKTPEDLAELASKYRKFLVTNFDDQPYQQFGKPKDWQNTMAILTQHAISVAGDFLQSNQCHMDDVAAFYREHEQPVEPLFPLQNTKVSQVLNSIKTILQKAHHAYQNQLLPTTMMCQNHSKAEVNVQLEQVQEQEVVLQQEQQVQQQVINSSDVIHSDTARETKWLVKEQRQFELTACMNRLQIMQVTQAYPPLAEQFATCFPSNLLLSANLSRTFTDIVLPPWHERTKLASFILATKNTQGELQFILLSKAEGDEFKDWIRERQPTNAWLMDLNGFEEEANSNSRLTELTEDGVYGKAVMSAVWHANLFNGNMRYLQDHLTLSQENFIANHQQYEYLLKHATRNPEQFHAAHISKVFNKQNLAERLQPAQFAALQNYQAINQVAGKLFNQGLLGFYQEQFSDAQIRQWQPQYLVACCDQRLSRLPQEQIINLSVARLNRCEPHQNCDYTHLVQSLTAAQIGLLTSEVLLNQLTSAQLANVVLPEALNRLHEDKLQYLNEQQKQHITHLAVYNAGATFADLQQLRFNEPEHFAALTSAAAKSAYQAGASFQELLQLLQAKTEFAALTQPDTLKAYAAGARFQQLREMLATNREQFNLLTSAQAGHAYVALSGPTFNQLQALNHDQLKAVLDYYQTASVFKSIDIPWHELGQLLLNYSEETAKAANTKFRALTSYGAILAYNIKDGITLAQLMTLTTEQITLLTDYYLLENIQHKLNIWGQQPLQAHIAANDLIRLLLSDQERFKQLTSDQAIQLYRSPAGANYTDLMALTPDEITSITNYYEHEWQQQAQTNPALHPSCTPFSELKKLLTDQKDKFELLVSREAVALIHSMTEPNVKPITFDELKDLDIAIIKIMLSPHARIAYNQIKVADLKRFLLTLSNDELQQLACFIESKPNLDQFSDNSDAPNIKRFLQSHDAHAAAQFMRCNNNMAQMMVKLLSPEMQAARNAGATFNDLKTLLYDDQDLIATDVLNAYRAGVKFTDLQALYHHDRAKFQVLISNDAIAIYRAKFATFADLKALDPKQLNLIFTCFNQINDKTRLSFVDLKAFITDQDKLAALTLEQLITICNPPCNLAIAELQQLSAEQIQLLVSDWVKTAYKDQYVTFAELRALINDPARFALLTSPQAIAMYCSKFASFTDLKALELKQLQMLCSYIKQSVNHQSALAFATLKPLLVELSSLYQILQQYPNIEVWHETAAKQIEKPAAKPTTQSTTIGVKKIGIIRKTYFNQVEALWTKPELTNKLQALTTPNALAAYQNKWIEFEELAKYDDLQKIAALTSHEAIQAYQKDLIKFTDLKNLEIDKIWECIQLALNPRANTATGKHTGA